MVFSSISVFLFLALRKHFTEANKEPEKPTLEEFFERFKNTEYAFDEFKADYDSMIKTVNTPKYE